MTYVSNPIKLKTLTLSDFPTGGALGTAANTVDKYGSFNINQTTASQVITLPTPTTNITGRILIVNNVGTSSVFVGGVSIPTDSGAAFKWDGDSWSSFSGSGGSSTVWSYDGNAVTAVKKLGTTDAFALPLITSGITRFTIDVSAAKLTGTGNTTLTTDTGSSLTIDSLDTGAVNLGSGSSAKTVTIGNTTGASGTNHYVGTGNYTLDGVGASSFIIGTSSTTGLVRIGGTSQTGNINLGRSGSTQTIYIHAGANVTPTTNIMHVTGQTGPILNMCGASTTGTLSVGNSSGGLNINMENGSLTAFYGSSSNTTGAVHIGSGSSTQTLTLGVGAGNKTVTVGSTNTTSTTTINAGTGAISLQGSVIAKSTTVSNLATGGAIGTAAATVDLFSTILVNQTTTGQTLTVPSPTTTTAGRIVFLHNIGSAAFTYSGTQISPNAGVSLQWDGDSWNSIGGGSGWSTTGNSGTTAGTNFAGTTDAQDYVIKTNSFERLRLSTSANQNITTMTFGGLSGNVITSQTNAYMLFRPAGTGGLEFDVSSGSAGIDFGAGTAPAYINIGQTGQTGPITLGQATATNTVNIATGTLAGGAVQTVNIASGSGTGTATINIGTSATKAATTNLGSSSIGSLTCISGKYKRAITAMTATGTISAFDSFVNVTTAGITVTMPTGVVGQIIHVINNSSGNITLSGTFDSGTNAATSTIVLTSGSTQEFICTSVGFWKRI